MSKTKFLTIAVFGLVLLNIGTLGFFMMHKPPPPRLEGPKQIIIDRLHFDDQQVTEYEKLIAQHEQDVTAKEKELNLAKQSLYGLLHGDDFAQKDSLLLVVGELHKEMEDIHFQHFTKIKELCTNEQASDFDALISDLGRYFAPFRKK